MLLGDTIKARTSLCLPEQVILARVTGTRDCHLHALFLLGGSPYIVGTYYIVYVQTIPQSYCGGLVALQWLNLTQARKQWGLVSGCELDLAKCVISRAPLSTYMYSACVCMHMCTYAYFVACMTGHLTYG